jgi:drug/metabolite transporter (DMT)-like permease
MATPKAAAGLKDTVSGIGFACLSTSLGGMTVALTRFIIDQTDPLSLTFLRYGGAVLVLAAVLAARSLKPRIVAADLAMIALLGVVMYAAFPYFMARALVDTTAARGALLFATMPLVTMVLGASFGIERLSAAKLMAIAAAIGGTMLALGERIDEVAPNALRGDFYMFLGMVAAASFNVFSRRYLIRYGSLPVMVPAMAVGVAVLFGLALVFGRPFSGALTFDATGWLVVFMLAIPGGALMMFSWGRALQLITPTQAAITVGLNPLTAIALGAWMLSEPVTARVLGGFLLIVVAIVLANRRPRRLSA